MQALVQEAQANISSSIAELNGSKSISHPWEAHSLKGGGVANIFKGGRFLEKGGVNVSTVEGPVFGDMVKMLSLDRQKDPSQCTFFATGISLVLHPYSPMVPTVHANYRYFEIEDSNQRPIAWFFGGGADLTPYYLYEEDAIHFHSVHKEACDKVDESLYPQLKREADRYFYLPHRGEGRGIGGIFSLKFYDRPAEEIYQWAKNCAECFIPSYLPIAEKRMGSAYTPSQKQWQLIRRGRYVEFNLMYDLGTLFGIKSKGHTENILMSMPPQVCWEYNYEPESGSLEEKLIEVLKKPRDWIKC